MGFVKEFKEFISRGNVIDLAVGIIIGGAFQKIVSSLVTDLVMPIVGLFVGGIDFTKYSFQLRGAETDAAGKVIKEPLTLNIGMFLQTLVDFLIVAFAIFLLIKAINHFRKKTADEPAAAPTKEEVLLTEIRDELRSARR